MVCINIKLLNGETFLVDNKNIKTLYELMNYIYIIKDYPVNNQTLVIHGIAYKSSNLELKALNLNYTSNIYLVIKNNSSIFSPIKGNKVFKINI